MDAQELRIGNWVRTTGIIYKQLQVDSIGEYGINPSLAGSDSGAWIEHEAHFDKIEGIPLTEEWLKNFGFESHDKGFIIRIDINTGLILEKSIYEDIGNAFDVIILQDPEHCVIFSWSIQYVHQLQNLFFALTSQELVISEKTANIE